MPQKPISRQIATTISAEAHAQLTELQAAIGAIQRPVAVPRVPQGAVLEAALGILHEAHADGRLAAELTGAAV